MTDQNHSKLKHIYINVIRCYLFLPGDSPRDYPRQTRREGGRGLVQRPGRGTRRVGVSLVVCSLWIEGVTGPFCGVVPRRITGTSDSGKTLACPRCALQVGPFADLREGCAIMPGSLVRLRRIVRDGSYEGQFVTFAYGSNMNTMPGWPRGSAT